MTARKHAPICSFPGCGRPHNSRGLCNPHGVMQRAGKPLRPVQGRTGPVERPAAERFAEKVAIQDDGCHVWTGGRFTNGYGAFSANKGSAKQKHLAHRWSYENAVGPVPHGLVLDHLCRNRACVNPDHLEPVTHGENLRRGYVSRRKDAA